jgi:hypothetical protein
LAAWLGKEITIDSSTQDPLPVGGKLTLIYDAREDVVRLCTRPVATQAKPWQSDFAAPCAVTLKFTRGTRYCTNADVKTGNSEVLSSCHRLRSPQVAMQSATTKGVEVNDLIIFLVPGAQGAHDVNIVIDSPSRVTIGGSTTGGQGDGGGGVGGSSSGHG